MVQLRQEYIAIELGVSRIPVREALHQLHSEGFVTLVSHKGAVVTPVSLDEILELHELCARLETWLLTLAIPRMTDEHLDAAQRAAEQYGRHRDDPDLAFELNWTFHRDLYAASERRATIDIVGRIYKQIERYTRMIVRFIDYNHRFDVEHHRLIKLFRAGDIKRARSWTAADCSSSGYPRSGTTSRWTRGSTERPSGNGDGARAEGRWRAAAADVLQQASLRAPAQWRALSLFDRNAVACDRRSRSFGSGRRVRTIDAVASQERGCHLTRRARRLA